FYHVYIFFFIDQATTEIYTLSLHDALPIYRSASGLRRLRRRRLSHRGGPAQAVQRDPVRRSGKSASRRVQRAVADARRTGSRCTDRKSTRLNSSHRTISYAVFCLKKKMIKQ